MSRNRESNQPDKSRIDRIQEVLQRYRIPAWLFYDFRGRDPLALRILGLDPAAHATRRWFYFVPAEGSPEKLVHAIESGRLESLPGNKREYLHWNTLSEGLQAILAGVSRVAMQYSEKNAIPYVSHVDAGTVDLVRSLDIDVISSADLVQELESVWSPIQVGLHREAASTLTEIVRNTFGLARDRIAAEGEVSEYAVQQYILQQFDRYRLVTDFPPIVAVNQNSGNPHYSPSEQSHRSIRKGDFLLIDLWAKKDETDSVFADITWNGFFGSRAPDKITGIFSIVRRARDEGVRWLSRSFQEGQEVLGYQVDDAVRRVISDHGFGEVFRHRTGHNLGREVHGTGVNFDNLETHDTRRVIPGLACTIEPGIYLQEFGVRSEINVLISPTGLEVTTPPQNDLLLLPI